MIIVIVIIIVITITIAIGAVKRIGNDNRGTDRAHVDVEGRAVGDGDGQGHPVAAPARLR